MSKKHYCKMSIKALAFTADAAILAESRPLGIDANVTVDSYQQGNELSDSPFNVTFD